MRVPQFYPNHQKIFPILKKCISEDFSQNFSIQAIVITSMALFEIWSKTNFFVSSLLKRSCLSNFNHYLKLICSFFKYKHKTKPFLNLNNKIQENLVCQITILWFICIAFKSFVWCIYLCKFWLLCTFTIIKFKFSWRNQYFHKYFF